MITLPLLPSVPCIVKCWPLADMVTLPSLSLIVTLAPLFWSQPASRNMPAANSGTSACMMTLRPPSARTLPNVLQNATFHLRRGGPAARALLRKPHDALRSVWPLAPDGVGSLADNSGG